MKRWQNEARDNRSDASQPRKRLRIEAEASQPGGREPRFRVVAPLTAPERVVIDVDHQKKEHDGAQAEG